MEIFVKIDLVNSLKCRRVNDTHAFHSIQKVGIPYTHYIPPKTILDFFYKLGIK